MPQGQLQGAPRVNAASSSDGVALEETFAYTAFPGARGAMHPLHGVHDLYALEDPCPVTHAC